MAWRLLPTLGSDDAKGGLLMTKTLRAVRWRFADQQGEWDGFTDDSYWNGWLNVWVTPPVREAVVQWAMTRFGDKDDVVSDLRSHPQGEDGLVYLGGGYTIEEADPNAP